MQAKDLRNLLLPFEHVCDPDSVVPAYRAIAYADKTLTCATGWAQITAQADLGFTNRLLIPGKALFSIASALPDSAAEVTFQIDGTALEWRAGASRGKFATLPFEAPGNRPAQEEGIVVASDGFGRAFEYGALSCGNVALATLGINGMQLKAAGSNWLFMSCDDVTISCYTMEQKEPSTGNWTISPKGAALLETLCDRHTGRLTFGERAIAYAAPAIAATVAQIPPLAADLTEKLAHYGGRSIRAPLPKDVIAAFVKRAQALSEVRVRCTVSILVADGAILLQFSEDTSMTEDFCLLAGIPETLQCSINVDAAKLAKALQHCNEIVLDHADRAVLVFLGEQYEYLVSGK